MQLRSYQVESVAAVHAAWQKNTSPLIVLPTGAGKSAVLGRLAADIAESGKKCLVLAHRQELISQNAKAARLFHNDVGIWSASLHMKQIRPITVAQVQSCRTIPAVFDYVLVDEAHLVSPSESATYKKLFLHLGLSKIKIAGMTATPYRLGQGMLTAGKDRMFDHIAHTVEVRWLIENGYLSPLVSAGTSETIDTTGIATRAGDFDSAEQEKRATATRVTGAVVVDLVNAMQTRKSAIVFASSVKHATDLASALRLRGVNAVSISGDTNDADRHRILNNFKSGQIQALCSCDILTTGFDAPCVDVIAMVRATKSPGLYVQICGRGTRLSPGKTDCLVLDYGGNIDRHGPFDDVTPPTKGAEQKPKYCKQCDEENKPSAKFCKRCKASLVGAAPMTMCKVCFAENSSHALQCGICDAELPRAERLQEKPSKKSILSTNKIFEDGTVEKKIFKATAWRHLGKEGKSDSVRIEYDNERGNPVAKEWLFPENPNGWHRSRIKHFFAEIGKQTGKQITALPEKIDEMIDIINHAPVACDSIRVKKDPSGHLEIVSRTWRLSE